MIGSALPSAPEVHPAIEFIGMAKPDLEALMVSRGEPAYRARQIWQWLYQRGAVDFAALTNLPRSLREVLAGEFTIFRPDARIDQLSVDGTRKWLLGFADGNQAESVFIPDEDRGTLCISSQVGCTLTCAFCHTGTQRLVRNLTTAEIVGQLLLARDAYGDWPSGRENRTITNIVMMGMGEPLFNYDNVAAALRIVMDPDGIAISRRRITLSTAGVVPLIRRVGEELGVKLAISLHAVRDELRDVLVPINRKYPLAELLQACREYPGLDNSQRITFEYVLLKDVNDSDADARALAGLVRGIPAKFNLIPFNPWPGSSFECPSIERMNAFAQILFDAGYTAPIRSPRGRDIMAACGQLRSASEAKRRASRKSSTADLCVPKEAAEQ